MSLQRDRTEQHGFTASAAPQLRAVLTDLLHDVANRIDDELWLVVLDVVVAVRVRDVPGSGKQPGKTVLRG
jgi:hypothetical protein